MQVSSGIWVKLGTCFHPVIPWLLEQKQNLLCWLKYVQLTGITYRKETDFVMNDYCVRSGVPLLCRSCCFPAQTVCPAQPADGELSLAERWAGRDPPAGNTRPEQTSLLGQITQWLHAKLLLHITSTSEISTIAKLQICRISSVIRILLAQIPCGSVYEWKVAYPHICQTTTNHCPLE